MFLRFGFGDFGVFWVETVLFGVDIRQDLVKFGVPGGFPWLGAGLGLW